MLAEDYFPILIWSLFDCLLIGITIFCLTSNALLYLEEDVRLRNPRSGLKGALSASQHWMKESSVGSNQWFSAFTYQPTWLVTNFMYLPTLLT